MCPQHGIWNQLLWGCNRNPCATQAPPMRLYFRVCGPWSLGLSPYSLSHLYLVSYSATSVYGMLFFLILCSHQALCMMRWLSSSASLLRAPSGVEKGIFICISSKILNNNKYVSNTGKNYFSSLYVFVISIQ